MKRSTKLVCFMFIMVFFVSLINPQVESVISSQTRSTNLTDEYPNDLSYYETHFNALADPTYNYGSSLSGSYLNTFLSNDIYHVLLSASSGSPQSFYDKATGEPSITYGTSSGTYDYTFTQNDVFQSVESASYIGGDTYANKTVTGYPTYTYGSSTSGGYWQTFVSNNSYHVSTTASYGSSGSQTKATAYWLDNSTTGTRTWSSPSYAQSSNDQRATVSTSAKTKFEYSHYLWGRSFGFSITDGATIKGIYVTMECSKSTTANTYAGDNIVRLLKGGALVGSNMASSYSYTTTDANYNYGSSSSLWGTTWTEAEIEGFGFGVVLSVWLDSMESTGNAQARVDYIQITVYFETTFYRIDMYNEFQFTEAPRAQVSAIFFFAEGKTSGDTVKIYLWNWTTSTWIDTSQSWDNTEHICSAGLDIEWYMNEEGYLRIRFYQTGLTISRTVSADYLIWHIHYMPTLYRVDYYYAMQFDNSTKASVTDLNWGSYGYSTVASKIYLYNWTSNSWYDTGQTVPASNSLKEGTGVSITSFMHSNGSMRIRYSIDGQSSSFINYVDWVYWYVTWGVLEYSLDFYYQFDFTNASKDYVTAIDWGAEGKTNGTTMSIYIYNYIGSTWTDTGADWTSTESTQGGEGDRTLHVATNGSMALRISYLEYASPFTASADHLWFNVTWVCPVSDPTLYSPTDGETVYTVNPTLEWNGVEVISGNLYTYRLAVANVSSFASTIINLTTSDTWYNVVSAIPIDQYWWKVRAIDYLGNVGAWSATWTFNTSSSLPTVHATVAAESVSYTSGAYYSGAINDTWTSNDEYHVSQSGWQTPSGPHVLYAWYTFHFTASPIADVVSITWNIEGHNDWASTGTDVYIWDYDLSYGYDTGCDLGYYYDDEFSATVDESTYMDYSGYMKIGVHYSSAASSAKTYVDYMKWDVIYTIDVNDTTPPTTPQPFYPLEGQFVSDLPLLTWNESTDDLSGVSYYRVAVSASPTFATTVLNTTMIKTWYQFSTSLNFITYYWEIRAVDEAGNIGNWSSVRSFTPTSDPQVNVVFRNVNNPSLNEIINPAQFNTTYHRSIQDSAGVWNTLSPYNPIINIYTTEVVNITVRDWLGNYIVNNQQYSYSPTIVVNLNVYDVCVGNGADAMAYIILRSGSIVLHKFTYRSDLHFLVIAGQYNLTVIYPAVQQIQLYYNLSISGDFGIKVSSNAIADLYSASDNWAALTGNVADIVTKISNVNYLIYTYGMNQTEMNSNIKALDSAIQNLGDVSLNQKIALVAIVLAIVVPGILVYLQGRERNRIYRRYSRKLQSYG